MFEDLMRIRTNEEIRRFLTAEGFRPEVIGETVDHLEIMVIDMHESGGKSGYPTTGHYLVLPPAWPLHNNPVELEVALEVIETTRALGFQPLSREVLQSSWKNAGWNNRGDEFPADGILRSDSRPTMAFYEWGEHYEVSIVIETGMAQPLPDRVHIQARAAEAAVQAFASAHL